jgi:hypothetical protein
MLPNDFGGTRTAGWRDIFFKRGIWWDFLFHLMKPARPLFMGLIESRRH